VKLLEKKKAISELLLPVQTTLVLYAWLHLLPFTLRCVPENFMCTFRVTNPRLLLTNEVGNKETQFFSSLCGYFAFTLVQTAYIFFLFRKQLYIC